MHDRSTRWRQELRVRRNKVKPHGVKVLTMRLQATSTPAKPPTPSALFVSFYGWYKGSKLRAVECAPAPQARRGC